jgi:hypothetical protein
VTADGEGLRGSARKEYRGVGSTGTDLKRKKLTLDENAVFGEYLILNVERTAVRIAVVVFLKHPQVVIYGYDALREVRVSLRHRKKPRVRLCSGSR